MWQDGPYVALWDGLNGIRLDGLTSPLAQALDGLEGVEIRGYKVIYRRYASLFFIVGTKPSPDETDNPENELGYTASIQIQCREESTEQAIYAWLTSGSNTFELNAKFIYFK